MIPKNRPDGSKAWRLAVALILSVLHFSISILTAFPGRHHHADAPEPRRAAAQAQEDASPDGSQSHPPGSHNQDSCQTCHLQAVLSGGILPYPPVLALPLRAHPLLPLHPAPHRTMVLSAGLQSRAPPSA